MAPGRRGRRRQLRSLWDLVGPGAVRSPLLETYRAVPASRTNRAAPESLCLHRVRPVPSGGVSENREFNCGIYKKNEHWDHSGRGILMPGTTSRGSLAPEGQWRVVVSPSEQVSGTLGRWQADSEHPEGCRVNPALEGLRVLHF